MAESYLAGRAGSDPLSGIPVQTQVPVGLVSSSILSVATEKQADIISRSQPRVHLIGGCR
jgi:hypothetical protein